MNQLKILSKKVNSFFNIEIGSSQGDPDNNLPKESPLIAIENINNHYGKIKVIAINFGDEAMLKLSR